MPADACRVPADDAQRDGGWLAMGWRVSRGELAGRWACREPTDVAQGPEDGTQRDGGCCAGGRQVLRRTTADGLRGGSPDVGRVLQMVCGASAGGAQRVEECCAGSKRIVRGGLASCQQKALRDYI